jgi:putative hydrolase of the HAD superfamily
MTTIPLGISTIIFDLGGVIVDLDVTKTVEAFAELSGMSHSAITGLYSRHPEFLQYERGELTDAAFRTMLRNVFALDVSDTALDAAWNAMIRNVPKRKLELAAALMKDFQVLVLSNTNGIHIRYVNEMISGAPFETHFHKCYYSHEVGMRKPEPRIYEHVLHDAGIQPGTAFFLDDNEQNIMAARALGIHAFHVHDPQQVYEVFGTL